MLTIEQKCQLLAADPMLSGVPVALIADLARTAREVAHEAGDFIYGRSDPATELYLLVRGSLSYPEIPRVNADEECVSARAVAGRLFGFGAALFGQARRAVSALCEDTTIVLCVGGASLVEACLRYGYVGRKLIERLVRAHVKYERKASANLAWPKCEDIACRVHSSLNDIFRDEYTAEKRSGRILALVGKNAIRKESAAALIEICRADRGRKVLCAVADDRGYADDEESTSDLLWYASLASGITVEEYLRRLREDGGYPISLTSLNEILGDFGLRSELSALTLGELSADETRYVRLLVQACGRQGLIIVSHRVLGKSVATRRRTADFVRAVSDLTGSWFVVVTDDIRDALRISDRTILIGDVGENGACSLVLELDSATSERGERCESPGGTVSPRWTWLPVKTFPKAWKRESTRPSNPSPEGRVPELEACREVSRDETGTTARNLLREKLRSGQFFLTVEFIPSIDSVLRDDLAALVQLEMSPCCFDGIAAYAVTDRVHSDHDPDPTLAALHLKKHGGHQPLVHFSGKDRELSDLGETLSKMAKFGLENILILSGDRLKDEPQGRRVRYLESVAAIRVARVAMPNLVIGAALNPFKYREEEAMAQYLKLGKKVGAGIDFAITQVGFDFDKYREALEWVRVRKYGVQLVANVMPLSARTARFVRKRVIPGITITDSLMELLEADEQHCADQGQARVRRRLALQIIGLERLGYAGVQVTGIHTSDQLAALASEVDAVSRELSSLSDWQEAWTEVLTFPGRLRSANPAPAEPRWYLKSSEIPARLGNSWRYYIMDRVHDVVFNGGIGARIMSPILKAVDESGFVQKLVHRVEHLIKGPLVGCESCGVCRLAATQYVCPETCPKGLANGPCGGTQGNRCEFGDRECIHSAKYRRARDAGVLAQLETWIIAAVPAGRRGTASWPAHFRGQGPQIEIVQPVRLSGRDEL